MWLDLVYPTLDDTQLLAGATQLRIFFLQQTIEIGFQANQSLLLDIETWFVQQGTLSTCRLFARLLVTLDVAFEALLLPKKLLGLLLQGRQFLGLLAMLFNGDNLALCCS